MSRDVEDVWAIVRERDSLRSTVKRLETENRRLRTIIAGYGDKTLLKHEDTKAHPRQARVPT